MNDLMVDFDKSIGNVVRSNTEYYYGKMGVKQNETSLSRDVLIKDTTLSTRLKNILTKYNVITIGNLEDLNGIQMLYFKGMGDKLHKEHGQFMYINRLGIHRG